MRLALAQINSRLGDFSFNQKKILEFTQRALERRCDLVIFPEAALFGYHPVDLLERPSLVKQQEKVLQELHLLLPKNISVLLGAIVHNPKKFGKAFFNAAVLIRKGEKAKIFPKQLLPTYDVFDEGRHIQPGDVTKNIFKFKGQKILVTVCEDIWAWPLKANPQYSRYAENPLLKIKSSAVDVVLNLSASPFTQTKFANRQLVTKATAKHFKAPLVYVNMVGAQDELIFDGGSFAIDKNGKKLAQCVRFAEDLNVVDLKTKDGGSRELVQDDLENMRSALVMGLRDFVQKSGFQKVHLGLSGGLDSALVACLAADALGPMNVTTFALPGPFSSPNSAKWARELAENLGTQHFEVPIVDSYNQVLKSFESVMGKQEFGLLNENLQARLRGNILMAYANRQPSLVLATSNKSELAVGYSTLYGDLCGALQPIGDVLKTEVYELAKLYNAQGEIIPKEIIERPPSAELRPNQTDQDSLPPYEKLDPIVRNLVEGLKPPKDELERKILRMMMKSEFKRWQAPPILKVSDHAFGRGRRLPIAHSASE